MRRKQCPSTNFIASNAMLFSANCVQWGIFTRVFVLPVVLIKAKKCFHCFSAGKGEIKAVPPVRENLRAAAHPAIERAASLIMPV
jgi:hypothetical protein